jgi:hypothetical protein
MRAMKGTSPQGRSTWPLFWRNLFVSGLALSLTGFGCADVLGGFREPSALGGAGYLLVAVGPLVAGVLGRKYLGRRLSPPGVGVLLGMAGIVAGIFAHERIASAVWEMKCHRGGNFIYCVEAAEKRALRGEKALATDLLRQGCESSAEYNDGCDRLLKQGPDSEDCKMMLRRCGAGASSANRPFTYPVCGKWAQACGWN